jgi:hypothetical protein
MMTISMPRPVRALPIEVATVEPAIRQFISRSASFQAPKPVSEEKRTGTIPSREWKQTVISVRPDGGDAMIPGQPATTTQDKNLAYIGAD